MVNPQSRLYRLFASRILLENHTMLSIKISRNNVKLIALITLITTLSGCASKYPSSPHSSTSSSHRERTYNTPERSTLPILRQNSAQQVFKNYGVNPTISTINERYSTFAMDVDTVSYQIAKTSLKSQQLPNKASVRVEEFINNFEYNYRSSNDIFSFSAEVVPSPYRPGFHLLHVGVKAKHITDEQRLPANLVLVADVSGSMHGDDKMALQKKALTTLVSQLSAKDSVAFTKQFKR